MTNWVSTETVRELQKLPSLILTAPLTTSFVDVVCPSAQGFLPLGRVRASLAPELTRFSSIQFTQNCLVFSPETTLTALLGDVFLWLREEGLCPERAPELLDVRDASGKPIAQADRALFRALGLHTQAVRLVGDSTFPKTIPLGKRSPQKRVGAGLWDNLAAGLVGAGESLTDALIREAKEEAGLTISPDALLYLGHFEAEREDTYGVLVETTHVFKTTRPLAAPRNLDGEVDEFRTTHPQEALALIAKGALMPEAAKALLMAFE